MPAAPGGLARAALLLLPYSGILLRSAFQTSEHLAAVEIMKLKNILILQNKIDLVKEKDAASQYEEILTFIRGTVADGSPIIPISAQLKYNIDVSPYCRACGFAPHSPKLCCAACRSSVNTFAKRSQCPCAISRRPPS